MPIQSISLENWKTHTNSSFSFDNGTNVLIGKMGSGKTSVMDAISFALFGTYPSLSSRSTSLSDIITSRPTKKEQSQITLSLSYNNINYKIIRTIKPKKTEAYLYQESSLIAGPSTSEVNQKLQSILSMTPELFSKAIYSEQNQLDFFLKLPPQQRKQLFDDLLDIDKYEKARKNSRTLKNRFSRLLEQKQKDSSQLSKNISTNKDSLLKEKTEKQSLLLPLQSQLNTLEKKYQEKSLLYTNLKNQKEKHTNLSKQLQTLKAQIQAYSQESFSLSNLQEKQSLLSSFKKRESQLKEKKENLESNFQTLQSNLLEIKHKSSALKKDLTSLLPKQLENKSFCPLCTQEIKSETKEALKKNAEQKNSEIQSQLSLLQKKESNLLEKKELIKKEHAATKTLLSETQSQISHITIEVSRLTDVQKKLSLLETYKQKAQETESLLSQIPYSEEYFLKTQEEKFSLQSQFSTLKEKKSGLQQLLSSLNTQLENIKLYETQLSSLQLEITNLQSAISSLDSFSLALAHTQLELRSHLLDSINRFLEILWTSLYPYSDYTSLHLFPEKLSNTDSYRLKALSSEGWLNVSSHLSGGEKSIAALCLRISFSLVLTKNLSYLILDEPTHNLDTQAIEKISELLNTQLPKLVEQIFIITHEKEMEKAATASLYLLDRNKSIDQPTQLQKLL